MQPILAAGTFRALHRAEPGAVQEAVEGLRSRLSAVRCSKDVSRHLPQGQKHNTARNQCRECTQLGAGRSERGEHLAEGADAALAIVAPAGIARAADGLRVAAVENLSNQRKPWRKSAASPAMPATQ
jgi:uncharacterized protein (DUF2345 family)